MSNVRLAPILLILLESPMVAVYQSGTYTMAEIASYFDVHSMMFSRAVRVAKRGL
jgi:hypothetical protein